MLEPRASLPLLAGSLVHPFLAAVLLCRLSACGRSGHGRQGVRDACEVRERRDGEEAGR